MANRAYTSQFNYSFERQRVSMGGTFTIMIQAAQAALADQGITYQAKRAGTAGNSITIHIINPGASHALTIAVAGTAITITLAHNGSVVTTTATLLVAALTADSNVTALLNVSGSGASPMTALASTPLAGGIDSVISSNAPAKTISVEETAEGRYTISLVDPFQALIACNMSIQHAAEDNSPLITQIKSANVTYGSSKTIVVDVLGSGGAPTQLDVGDAFIIDLALRNSSVA